MECSWAAVTVKLNSISTFPLKRSTVQCREVTGVSGANLTCLRAFAFTYCAIVKFTCFRGISYNIVFMRNVNGDRNSIVVSVVCEKPITCFGRNTLRFRTDVQFTFLSQTCPNKRACLVKIATLYSVKIISVLGSAIPVSGEKIKHTLSVGWLLFNML